MTNYSGSYLVELDRWGIKNDGSDAPNTTIGINNAIIWAAKNNFKEIILPKGIYLIDETKTLEPESYMTLNLNGSTLRIRDNNLPNYAIISFKRNQKFSRITNGKIEGDKNSHDYSSGGTHEGGYGIQIGSFTPSADGGNNTRFITVDNLEIFNCTGDAITVNSTFGQIFPTPTNLAASWEQGGISTTNGTLTSDLNKIRSKLTIDLSQTLIKRYGYFGLYGNGYGALGSGILCDYFDVIFYRTDNTFLSSRKQVQFFDEIEVPLGASYAKIMLHQNQIPNSSNCLINVRVPSFPQHSYIEKCNLHHCRRQGISLCGTKHIYIRDNQIHHIGGTPPQAGIDVEDGYDLNQYIYIERNNFHDNHFYDVVVVNGKSIFIKENKISYTIGGGASLAINGGADKVIITNNNLHNAKVILSGDLTFENNNLFATQINVLGTYSTRPISLYNNLFHNCKLVIDNPFPYLVKIDACRFFNDNEKLNAFSSLQWTIEFKNEPQIISNCLFEGLDVFYLTYAAATTFKGGWIFENNTFKNVKNPSLLAGTYTNCSFIGIDFLGTFANINDDLVLINCEIHSNDVNNTLINLNNLKSFVMKGCTIHKKNGHILRIVNITDYIYLKNNIFKVIDDTLPRSILQIQPSTSGNLIIENNIISAKNLNQIGMEIMESNNIESIIRNNILKKAIIKFSGKEILDHNIINSVIDPYYKMSAEPTSKYFRYGQKLENTNLMGSTFEGWVCVKAGLANNSSWKANTVFSLYEIVNANNKVYRCIVAGKSGLTAPSHTFGTAADGTVTWQYVDEKAIFKTYGFINN
ncbi:right-handed parallel beta-helix repeat-containing protein [Bacillus sp. V2I10]|uniref:right-handed parallel beta-helix repeat-containing protein n=1 Tax=Bacillus sp. V2I10 TaxID=3042276 RepID=UPI002785A89E|nr:right-handed parallel beta-helix repeat-containing protein [Bacillus sp. V2I10]MDQ0859291.1 hypothetical protein [Bacillus sp. V2I10]